MNDKGVTMDINILIQTAEELNVTLGLVPLIDVTLSEKDITTAIKKVSPLVTTTDHFSDTVVSCLVTLSALPEDVENAFSVITINDEVIANDTPVVKETRGRMSNKKKAEKKAQKSRRKKKAHIVRIEELIAEGTHTAAQIVETVLQDFDIKKDTVANYVRCSRNPKYNMFSRDVIEDSDGIYKFK